MCFKMNALRISVMVLLLVLLTCSTITFSTALFTECSTGGVSGNNDIAASVRNNASSQTMGIDCGLGNHILISDIMFRIANGTSCDRNSICSKIVTCEYRMSDNCNDTQFLATVKSCTAQQKCILRHDATSKMNCNGTTRIPNYTTLKYRCEADSSISRQIICSNSVSNGSSSHYISSRISPHHQNTTCCCNATAVNDLYILYLDYDSFNPHLELGVHYINKTYETVSFGGKVGNVRINASGELRQIESFSLSWRNFGAVGNATFLAKVVGNGSVSCSSRCHQSSTTLPPVTTTSVSHPTTSTSFTNGSSRAPGKTSWRSPALLYGSIAAGCCVFLASVIAIIICFRRKRGKENQATEVIYSRPIPGGAKPDAPNLDGLDVPQDVGTSLYSSSGGGDEYLSAMSDVTASSFTPYFASNFVTPREPNGVRENAGKSVHLYDNATPLESNENNRVSASADLKYHMYDNAVFKPSDALEDSAPSEMYGTRGETEGQRVEYHYADLNRPTKIMKQVLESPPVLTDTYNARYPRGSAFTYVSVD